MPSPFPGMDPYIETPELWPDFHNNLASALQAQLNLRILPRYFARLTPYVTYEVIQVERSPAPRSIRPDVAVLEQRKLREASVTFTPLTPAPVTSRVPLEVEIELMRVEIHKADTQQLVTVIEILSPVNKRVGHDAHTDYLRKRRDLLRSPAHLMEIDLLRGGERLPLLEPVPPAAYYVLLSRATRRPQVEVWPIQLADKLPVLPVPLLEPDPDVPLDLGAAASEVYERGAYGVQIDYSQPPPPPPLTAEEIEWVKAMLAAKRSTA